METGARRHCRLSGEAFVVSQADLDFYARLGVPAPTLSPRERSRRRLAFRNGRNLYWRTCAGTGKNIISLYSPDKDVCVFEDEYWWAGEWDAREHGRPFDFSRSFFEQFRELDRLVPRTATNGGQNENCPYVSYAGWNKDCHLIFYSDHNRDCFYLCDCFYDEDCADCSYVNRSELCYECVMSHGCYNCRYVVESKNCSDSWFLQNCVGCKNCYRCVNLRGQQYCIGNTQFSPEEYRRRLAEIALTSTSGIAAEWGVFRAFCMQLPCRHLHGIQNEQVTGDYLTNCKDVRHCFCVEHSERCAFLSDCQKCTDCYDVDGWGGTGAELLLECQTVGEGAHNVWFCDHVFNGVADVCYSQRCISSSDLFGCAGLRRAQYCILNKQYSRAEYFDLRARIIAHMQHTGEWGEFFPVELSPFGYNETLACTRFPLSKEEVIARGWKWFEEPAAEGGTAACAAVPDRLEDAPASICSELFGCAECGKPYKLQRAEYALYQKLRVPVPRFCHGCRYARRRSLLGDFTLYARNCDGCHKELSSSYSPRRKEYVLCEDCFEKAILAA